MAAALVIAFGLTLTNCKGKRADGKVLTLAINSGVEGDALKQAARDYEAQTGVHINIAEFPYANLFEKELIDLNAHSGAYDLIMLDDPWFPKFAALNVLTDLTPLLKQRGMDKPDDDFVSASIALCEILIRPERFMRCLTSATRSCSSIVRTFFKSIT